VAILEPERFILAAVAVDLDWQGLAGVEHHGTVDFHLDGAGCQARIFSAGRTLPHTTGGPQDIFVTHLLQRQAGLSAGGRVGDQLCDAIAVAEINEQDWAMVTAAMCPAGQRHRLATMFEAELSAGMCPKHARASLRAG